MEKEIKWLLKDKYKGKETKGFYKDIKRLEEGEPLDYVIGFTEFLGCKIDLSKRPLIPRPETEYWVSEELKEIKNGKVLDIFAGSGCIGIAVLKKRRGVLCDFSEKDKNSIQQIKINLKLNKINPSQLNKFDVRARKKRYKVIQSDVFENVNGKYDYIFANPPYVAKKKKNKVQASVLKYEPKIALFAGLEGLFFINKLLKQAKKYLNKDGKIFIEFGVGQKGQIEALIKKYRYSEYKFHKDQYGKLRWVMLK